MPVDLDTQILKVLRAMNPGDRPATIGDLARRFGLSAAIILASARRMVDAGTAKPSMIEIHGVRTLHGLLPQAAPVAVPAPEG
jgi:DNA-binding Lrp family transcriptional regulator